MRVQITAKYGYTWRLQYCFKNGPLTENGNSAKKRAGNETAASPANGNGKPEFENRATLLWKRMLIFAYLRLTYILHTDTFLELSPAA